MSHRNFYIIGFRAIAFTLLLAIAPHSQSASSTTRIPPAEQLLPENTLLFITAPDFTKLKQSLKQSPEGRFWNDPAMRAFRENFVERWNRDVVAPLEREVGIDIDEIFGSAEGQVTFAVTPATPDSPSNDPFDAVLVVDAGSKSSQLSTNLTQLRNRWRAVGKSMRTERIRDCELMIVAVTTNDLPKSLRQLLPQRNEIQDLGANGEVTQTRPPKVELTIGQSGSLLIIGDSLAAAEKILARTARTGIPCLADNAVYQGSSTKTFRDSHLYGWVNVKGFMDGLARDGTISSTSVDPLAPPSPVKMLNALGFGGVTAGACSVQFTPEGRLLQIYAAAPEASRRGLFKLLAGTPKDARPPRFVPADARKYQRWRVSARQAWTTYQRMQNEIGGEASGLDSLIETAATRAKDKDPNYDLRKALFSNLGDDLITYEKSTGKSDTGAESSAAILLIGSPDPEQLAGALKILFSVFGGADSSRDREFLGHKIFTTPFPGFPIPLLDTAKLMGKSVSFAAAGGYLALSADDALLEEFLRSSDGPVKPLRELAGLQPAQALVMDSGTHLFGFENRQETFRGFYEGVRNRPGILTNAPPPGPNSFLAGVPFATPDKSFKDWMDFGLLPAFQRISKYFGIEVYSGSVSVDGLTWKEFAPIPPGLREGGGR